MGGGGKEVPSCTQRTLPVHLPEAGAGVLSSAARPCSPFRHFPLFWYLHCLEPGLGCLCGIGIQVPSTLVRSRHPDWAQKRRLQMALALASPAEIESWSAEVSCPGGFCADPSWFGAKTYHVLYL